MSLPRMTLPEAGAGLALGAAFGCLMGGVSSAGIGAMVGVAFAAASAKKEEKRGKEQDKRPLSEARAQDRRKFFLRVLASSKIGEVEKAATGFRRGGALTAARALRQHAIDLRAIEAKAVDHETLERFTEIVALARAQWHDESPEVKAAEANLERARAAREEPTP